MSMLVSIYKTGTFGDVILPVCITIGFCFITFHRRRNCWTVQTEPPSFNPLKSSFWKGRHCYAWLNPKTCWHISHVDCAVLKQVCSSIRRECGLLYCISNKALHTEQKAAWRKTPVKMWACCTDVENNAPETWMISAHLSWLYCKNVTFWVSKLNRTLTWLVNTVILGIIQEQ